MLCVLYLSLEIVSSQPRVGAGRRLSQRRVGDFYSFTNFLTSVPFIFIRYMPGDNWEISICALMFAVLVWV